MGAGLGAGTGSMETQILSIFTAGRHVWHGLVQYRQRGLAKSESFEGPFRMITKLGRVGRTVRVPLRSSVQSPRFYGSSILTTISRCFLYLPWCLALRFFVMSSNVSNSLSCVDILGLRLHFVFGFFCYSLGYIPHPVYSLSSVLWLDTPF